MIDVVSDWGKADLPAVGHRENLTIEKEKIYSSNAALLLELK